MINHFKKLIRGLILLFVILVSFSSNAQTIVPKIFGNYMVLQRNDSVKIWGWDSVSTTIEVLTSWNLTTYNTVANSNGKWSVLVSTPDTSSINNIPNPYSVIIAGSDTIMLSNVVIGEVWLCSGQSNMQMPLQGFGNLEPVDNGTAIINESVPRYDNYIRHIEIPRTLSKTPQDTLGNKNKRHAWQGPTTIANQKRLFGAIAYMFARQMHDSLNMPIGVISCAKGGTIIEAWLDSESTFKFSFIDSTSSNYLFPDDTTDPAINTPSAAYNGMIHPIKGYGIKGMLWYQGEGNRGRPDEYKELLPELVSSFRQKWEINFPFYYVQIAPHSNNRGPFWESNRQSYYSMNDTLGQVGMVISSDLGQYDSLCINYVNHPPKKQEIADRLARWALVENYGFTGFIKSGPIARMAYLDSTGTAIMVDFDFAGNSLVPNPDGMNNYEIAGLDHVFFPAITEVNTNNTLKFTSPLVISPQWVRTGEGNCPDSASLHNEADLPASAFTMEANVSVGFSIKETKQFDLSIYPNPTNNLIQIEIENYKGSFEAELYDFTGKLLETTNKTSLSLDDYLSGIYLLKITFGDRVEQMKVVKE